MKVGDKVITPSGIRGTIISISFSNCEVKYEDFPGLMHYNVKALRLQKEANDEYDS